MKSKVYDIVLHSPMGPKKGTLTLLQENDGYSADVHLMKHLNHFTAVTIHPGEYLLSGALWTLVGDVACTVNVKIENGTLSAAADTAKGIMKMEGRLIESVGCESN